VERTLVLIKPQMFIDHRDVVANGANAITAYYWAKGLGIVGHFQFRFSVEMATRFYQEHVGKPFFAGLIEAMTCDDCIALIVGGDDAVNKVREINGATDPRKALPGTIRHKYGRMESGPYNAVHGSDSPESAEREIKIIFG